MGNARIDVFAVESEAARLATALVSEGTRIAANPGLTPEGKQTAWEDVKGRYAGDVVELQARVRMATEGAARMVDYARAEALGPASDPANPDVTVELALSRVLSRRSTWSVEQVRDTLAPMMGTPLARAVMDEMVARGVVEAGHVGAVVDPLAEQAEQARVLQPVVQTAIQSVVAPHVAEVEALLEGAAMTTGAQAVGGLSSPVSLQSWPGTRLVVWESGRVDTDAKAVGYDRQ